MLPAQSVVLILDQNTVVKPEFWTARPPDPGTTLSTVAFAAQGTLRFPQSGRTYLVTLSWDQAQGQFTSVGPVADRPAPSATSYWVREASRTGPTQIAWEVYIPTAADYAGVTLTASAAALGSWSNPGNLTPACAWSQPVLVP